MAIAYENSPLNWTNAGVEPSETVKTKGYGAGEKLPASHLNHLIKNKQLVETELQTKLSDLHTTVNNKVDKVAGKDLSTNDYTTAEKTKLAGIATGATANVVENVLTSTSTAHALSAAQGKVLNDNKVDKVSGKQLSTNDYTTAEKNKLAGIAAGATANVVENVLTSTSTANALSAAQGKVLNDTKLPVAGGTITGNLTVNGTLTNAGLTTSLNNKVDKVSGKQLSTNDYTTAEKNKLAGIAAGATANVVENILTGISTANALSVNMGRVLNETKVHYTSNIDNAVDLDTMLTPGVYELNQFAGSAGINYPIQANINHAVLEVYKRVGARAVQVVHVPRQDGIVHTFERWWADGTWRPWSQISTGSIDLTGEYMSGVNESSTTIQMLRIANGKFNVCTDFAKRNGYVWTMMPKPLCKEGARICWTFQHIGHNDRTMDSHYGQGKNTEYRLELFSSSHPNTKYMQFKPYGRSISECMNDWFAVSYSRYT